MELRDLPSVDALAAALSGSGLPAPLLTAVARSAVDQARTVVAAGGEADPTAIAADAVATLEASRSRPIINATGVLLHTNLGRAPLAVEAARRAAHLASRYGNVELSGDRRGGRGRYLHRLLAAVTGAEAAVVVNNNAGALALSLAALAGGGGRVAVSRGELIEIGGSFRLPEVMEAVGVRLVEVGTTNRTRLADFERVIGHVDAVLKVHPSNYRLEGFVEDAGWDELAALAGSGGIPFIADIGSGLLDAATPWLETRPQWLDGEPAMRQTVNAGASVTLASGDKLFGGPQAGMAVGTATAVARMAAHPLARALRVDGATIAALEATVEMYAAGRGGEIPFWAMATTSVDDLADRLRRLAATVGTGEVRAGESLPGAGSVPGAAIPTPVLVIDDEVERRWQRLLDAGILASRRDGTLVVDLRAVDRDDDDAIAAALRG